MTGRFGVAPILAVLFLAAPVAAAEPAPADEAPMASDEGPAGAAPSPPAADAAPTSPGPAGSEPASAVPGDGEGETPSGTPGSGMRSGLPSLDGLTATRERPLFAPDRRPPAVPAEAEAPTAPEVVEPAAFRPVLVGVVAGPGVGIAMVKKATGDGVVRVKVDEAFEGWTLSAVDERSATFARGEERVVATLARVKTPSVTQTPGEEGGAPGETGAPP